MGSLRPECFAGRGKVRVEGQSDGRKRGGRWKELGCGAVCGVNSVVGGIYNPLHLSRKKGAFSEQECCRGVKFRKPRSGGPGLLWKVVDDAID